MNDPYRTLGIPSTATDAEVKKAYRELARKYHPDNYHNNPLSDLAQEKMKEINDAYNTIMRSRDGGGKYKPGGRSSGAANASAEGSRVRAAINSGDLRHAEELLGMFAVRNAEWHFLMGSLCYRKGWLDDAMSYFQTAVNMEPGNSEYRQALAFMSQGGPARRHGHGPLQGQGCDMCDCCTAMLCMNMCCRCN